MFLITWLLGGTVPSKRTIKQYEYKSPPLSLFERLFLDKFWTALPGAVYAVSVDAHVLGFCIPPRAYRCHRPGAKGGPSLARVLCDERRQWVDCNDDGTYRPSLRALSVRKIGKLQVVAAADGDDGEGEGEDEGAGEGAGEGRCHLLVAIA